LTEELSKPVDVVNEIVFEEITLVVAMTPLTFEVMTFPEVVAVCTFTPEKVVLERTPLTFDVMVELLVEVDKVKVLLLITELVATTPLIVVVRVFPVRV
jgi:hypothetical protein